MENEPKALVEKGARKVFARSPMSGMWLGLASDGTWQIKPDFSKARAFGDKHQASAAWDRACMDCLERCAKTKEAIPAWASAKPVFLLGRTPESPPLEFDYYLALIDGRFVSEKPSGYVLVTDERDAHVYGTRDEAQKAIDMLKNGKTKSAAILPLTCQPREPIDAGVKLLDPLAQASYAVMARAAFEKDVPLGKVDSEKGKGKSKSI